jgi:hypothetical protein
MTPKRTSIMLYSRAEAFINARSEDNFSSALNQSIERYEEILKQARVKLLEIFTEKEMALIIDVLNGTLFSEPISIHMVYGEVGDGINMDALDQKWEVDGKALVEKVRNLDYAEKVALVDAVERWWNSTGQEKQPGWLDTLKRG